MSTTGRRFAEAIATRDQDAFAGTLANAVDFKGLTPGRFWEASSPGEVADVVLGTWFEESDHIVEHEVIDGDDVADTHLVSYRFDITNDDGRHVVEQQVYYRVDPNDRIDYARVVCSGYRPVAG
jgi:hypothetical protein